MEFVEQHRLLSCDHSLLLLNKRRAGPWEADAFILVQAHIQVFR